MEEDDGKVAFDAFMTLVHNTFDQQTAGEDAAAPAAPAAPPAGIAHEAVATAPVGELWGPYVPQMAREEAASASSCRASGSRRSPSSMPAVSKRSLELLESSG